MHNTNPPQPEQPYARPILWLLVTLTVLIPLFGAGTTPLAAIFAQILSILLLSLVFWVPQQVGITRWESFVLVLLLLTPLIYLVPLPQHLLEHLPGRTVYAEAASLLRADAADGWQALTVVRQASVAAALALLVPVAVYVAARSLQVDKLHILLSVLLGVAGLQALIGLMQSGTGAQGAAEAFWAVEGLKGMPATGTYSNRNHLAGLLEMMLPVTLALYFFHLGRRGERGTQHGWRRKAALLGSVAGHKAVVYGVTALLILIAIVFTRSRSGILLAIIGIMLTTILFSRRIGGSNAFGPAGSIVSLALAAGLAIGLAPVLDRFSVAALADSARIPLFELTLQGAGSFFPVGSGPGTFPAVFPALQPVELGQWFINRAHNDYLEWIFDLGVLGAAIPMSIIVLYAIQWTRVYSSGAWSRERFIQVGAGIGLLLLMLHEVVDYNLHTPANQLAFALLAAVFFTPSSKISASEADGGRRRKRRTPDLPVPMAVDLGSAKLPPDQIENPFR